MEPMYTIFNGLTSDPVAQVLLSLWMILNLIWGLSWVVTILKYFIKRPSRTDKDNRRRRKFKLKYYRYKSTMLQPTCFNAGMDYVMLIVWACSLIITAAFWLSDILFK